MAPLWQPQVPGAAPAPDDAMPQAGGEESTRRHSVHSRADYCIYHAPKTPGAGSPCTLCALTARFSVKLETGQSQLRYFPTASPCGTVTQVLAAAWRTARDPLEISLAVVTWSQGCFIPLH